jgi:hypothetical protein
MKGSEVVDENWSVIIIGGGESLLILLLELIMNFKLLLKMMIPIVMEKQE